VGPLNDNVMSFNVAKEFTEFGTVSNVSLLKASETTCKRGYGFIEFKEGSRAVCRAFGAKIIILGQHVEITLSRMAMEVILTETSAFFHDAFIQIDDIHLERHFKEFGQVFRCTHLQHRVPDADEARRMGYEPPAIPNKSFGFVDFVDRPATEMCLANKVQLMPPQPGQYCKLTKHLPLPLHLEFLAIGDQHGIQIKKKLEKTAPTEGSWGNPIKIKGAGTTTSQVRIPRMMVSKLIGERGKTILTITRDSKTKINIPRVENDTDKNILISITGKKEDIRTAQYLMQKVLKGQR